ncbi:MAG: tetratricopeptide repeat protein [Flavobacteriales bacterium]|nr:tetratricopeptide repeat protein [Flavobacteriales bacterium]
MTTLAQNAKLDSLKANLESARTDIYKLNALNELCLNYLSINPDTSELYAKQGIRLAKQLGSKTELTRAIRNKADAIARQGKDSLAIRIYEEALAIEPSSNDSALRANIYGQMGGAHYHLADYDKALTAFFSALELLKSDSLKQTRAEILNNIGNVYYFVNMPEAVKYYEQSLQIHQEMDNLEGIASQLGNLGLIYINTKDYEKAISYSEQSLKYYRSLGNDRSVARSAVNLAYAYKEVGKTGLALRYAKESLEIATRLNVGRAIATSTIMLGNIYFKLEDYGAAIQYYDNGLKMVRELGMRSYEWETMFFLAESYRLTGEKDKALTLYPEVISLKDSINTQELLALTAEKDAKYQSLQKEGQIKLLTAEAAVADLELRKGETYLLAATIITFLLGIVSLIVFFFYRVRTRANVALEKKNNEISKQKQEIEEKNLHITDSIRYAERLQSAILPKDEMFAKHFSAHTILYRPKDIVSGDFYWMESLPPSPSFGGGAICYLAVADCTGHGVPGAMVSMVGFQGLNKAVLEEKLTSPAAILQRLSDHVEEAFEKSGGSVKDGMDICLVAIDTKKRQVTYAGAHNALWILSSKEELPNANLREEENGYRMFELKADRRSIGGFMDAGSFNETTVALNEGDRLFLFSDGFADQFGGPQGKKLGSKRMRDTVREMALSGNLVALGAIFEDWKGTEEQVDDVTVISVAI